MTDNHPAGDLWRAWGSVGSARSVDLEAVELWRVELPFVRPVATAKGVHRSRPLVLVKVMGRTDGDQGSQTIEGWGECAALADATYDHEDVNGSFRALQDALVPALFDLARPTGPGGSRLPPPSGLGPTREAAPYAPLAFAALEMAVADAHLRAEHRSLADVLGVRGREVELGAVVGQNDSIDALVEEAMELAASGFRPAQDEDRDDLGRRPGGGGGRRRPAAATAGGRQRRLRPRATPTTWPSSTGSGSSASSSPCPTTCPA